MLVREHYQETKKLLNNIKPRIVGRWLLNDGYFPEEYVLPPCFKAGGVKLNREPFFDNLNNLKEK